MRGSRPQEASGTGLPSLPGSGVQRSSSHWPEMGGRGVGTKGTRRPGPHRLIPGTGQHCRVATHLWGLSSQSAEASGHTHSGHTCTQPKTQAHTPHPPGIQRTPTYFNDSRDTCQGCELIGCSFTGCGGHQTQEGGLGEKEGRDIESCPGLSGEPPGCRRQGDPLLTLCLVMG